MLDWLRKLFLRNSGATPPLWAVMEKMDPLLAFERFQALQLPQRQRPIVQGLIDGSIKHSDLDAVSAWIEMHREAPDGIDALVFALQHALGSKATTYLFDGQVPVPTARFPALGEHDALTVLFNDRECHLQITSLSHFVAENEIETYTLESLNVDQLRARITGRPAGTGGSQTTRRKVSITIERSANQDETLLEAVETDDIADALRQAGFDVSPTAILLGEPIWQLGLHKVPVQLGADIDPKLFVWVVPADDAEGTPATS